MTTANSTNDAIDKITKALGEVHAWAVADSENSAEAGARDQAASDRRRAKRLAKAIALVASCHRD